MEWTNESEWEWGRWTVRTEGRTRTRGEGSTSRQQPVNPQCLDGATFCLIYPFLRRTASGPGCCCGWNLAGDTWRASRSSALYCRRQRSHDTPTRYKRGVIVLAVDANRAWSRQTKHFVFFSPLLRLLVTAIQSSLDDWRWVIDSVSQKACCSRKHERPINGSCG